MERKSKLNLKDVRGFTLVELLVVVAIIGILAGTGVPQYKKMMQKARRAEGNTALGNIATAEAAFYAENQAYTTNVVKIGAEMDTNANLRYTSGFSADGACTAQTAGVAAAAAAILVPPGANVIAAGTVSTSSILPNNVGIYGIPAAAVAPLSATQSSLVGYQSRMGNGGVGATSGCTAMLVGAAAVATSDLFPPVLSATGAITTPGHFKASAFGYLGSAFTPVVLPAATTPYDTCGGVKCDTLTIDETRQIKVAIDAVGSAN